MTDSKSEYSDLEAGGSYHRQKIQSMGLSEGDKLQLNSGEEVIITPTPFAEKITLMKNKNPPIVDEIQNLLSDSFNLNQGEDFTKNHIISGIEEYYGFTFAIPSMRIAIELGQNDWSNKNIHSRDRVENKLNKSGWDIISLNIDGLECENEHIKYIENVLSDVLDRLFIDVRRNNIVINKINSKTGDIIKYHFNTVVENSSLTEEGKNTAVYDGKEVPLTIAKLRSPEDDPIV